MTTGTESVPLLRLTVTLGWVTVMLPAGTTASSAAVVEMPSPCLI